MAKASNSSRVPGWVWVITPALAIAFIGFVMYLRTVPAGKDLESVRLDAGKVLQQGIDKAKEEVANQAVKPAYDFYRLLEDQKVESPRVDQYVSTPKLDPDEINDPIEQAGRNQAIAAGRIPAPAPAAKAVDTTAATIAAMTRPASSAAASVTGTAASAVASSAPSIASSTPATTGKERYLLQVGSFRTSADAENLRANLAFSGVPGFTEASSVNGATWYRVYVGPYTDKNKLAQAQASLAANSIHSIVVKKP
jgi:cell division protein FtsN